MAAGHRSDHTEQPSPSEHVPPAAAPVVRAEDTSLEPLEREIAFYLQHLGEWGAHEGKHVLIHEHELCGFYPTRDDALIEGFRRFGRVAFLVKQVVLNERPRPLVEVVL